MVEEPEHGLYVSHLEPPPQRTEPDGTLGRFVFTTHGPYFIDLFDRPLDGTHVFRSGAPFSVLAKPDQAKLKQLFEGVAPGAPHFQDLLA